MVFKNPYISTKHINFLINAMRVETMMNFQILTRRFIVGGSKVFLQLYDNDPLMVHRNFFVCDNPLKIFYCTSWKLLYCTSRHF